MKKVIQSNSGATQTIDYLFGFEYENGTLQTFPHAEGYVKNNAGNYVYHYIYKDHLGNNRLVYADLNNDGTINPANEIVEENNYYPFGLKHEGYNNLPGAGYKYKFLNKEYEDSFALNVTETDFRHYDSALGRFNVVDPLAELAPDFTPYRYGFNNPVFWQDASGLFESYAAARYYQLSRGLFGSSIMYDNEAGDGHWYIDTGSSMISQLGDKILKVYEMDGEWISDITESAGGGGPESSSSKKSDGGFWKFIETGGMFNIWGKMKDDPGFKPNSRKRSVVDASMNYDQVITQTLAKYWWARVREILGGIDTRNGNIRSNLNITVTKPKSDTSSSEENTTTKDKQKIIKIQLRNFILDESTNTVVPRTHYVEPVYESQVPEYIKMMKQDSMNQLPK
ncbi:RHS repeat-associated core domain-containing protein [Myroides sp. JBRI-B21084]|uniref:RHS repeat domain-containing protein n=1 Tax=Myroides sp. JBRI-B21084 TaxID=3119977 RepID=UPI0026E29A61|nr:RHS repeat-associated core domain-containing protein [Paenimyroides cloacae]WKW46719.1 RHS repeat-associated core domain-containing protein [Paenimyroides cloacae]